jgi:hypothetical protein
MDIYGIMISHTCGKNRLRVHYYLRSADTHSNLDLVENENRMLFEAREGQSISRFYAVAEQQDDEVVVVITYVTYQPVPESAPPAGLPAPKPELELVQPPELVPSTPQDGKSAPSFSATIWRIVWEYFHPLQNLRMAWQDSKLIRAKIFSEAGFVFDCLLYGMIVLADIVWEYATDFYATTRDLLLRSWIYSSSVSLGEAWADAKAWLAYLWSDGPRPVSRFAHQPTPPLDKLEPDQPLATPPFLGGIGGIIEK